MTYGYQYQAPQATDILSHIGVLRFYAEFELAEKRLLLIAENFDDPEWIEEMTVKWLNEDKYWNSAYTPYYDYNEAGYFNVEPSNSTRKREKDSWE